MATITDVEAMIRQLPLAEARCLSAWLEEYLNDAWDEQMKADAESGKLDRVFAKALADIEAGKVRDLDAVLDDA
jgi:hypothetical protein